MGDQTAGHADLAQRRRPGGVWKGIILGNALAVIVTIAALAPCLLLSRTGDPGGPPTAAIVDHLSLTYPNQGFIDRATATLEQAGYAVDYYPGEEVTVDFYRGLSAPDYDMIIFRAHSTRFQEEWRSRPWDLVFLFTSEPYSEAVHVEDQALLRLGVVRYQEDSDKYFGIAPRFVTRSMEGRFDDTTILIMGCEGLSTATMAEAFVQKGASSVISWSDTVSAAHTDAATERLLEHLLVGRVSPGDAVAQTMAEVGPDPWFDSVLLSYPPAR